MQAILFVKFVDKDVAEVKGFDPTYNYPVYHIDVNDEYNGEKKVGIVANFLLANKEGHLIWVSQNDVVRSSPPHAVKGGDRSKRKRYSPNDNNTKTARFGQARFDQDRFV